jgi:hypothetical protein
MFHTKYEHSQPSLSAASLCDFYKQRLADINIKFLYPPQISTTAIPHPTKFPAGDRASVLTNRCNRPIWNRMQFRAVTGLLTRYNTPRKHLYIMELIDSFLCRRCGIEEKNAGRILCECEAFTTLRHTHLGSFFSDLDDVRSPTLGAIWTGLPWFRYRWKGYTGPVKSLRASGPKGLEPSNYSILNRSERIDRWNSGDLISLYI